MVMIFLTADNTRVGTRSNAVQNLDSPDLSMWSDSEGFTSDGSGAMGSMSIAVFLYVWDYDHTLSKLIMFGCIIN